MVGKHPHPKTYKKKIMWNFMKNMLIRRMTIQKGARNQFVTKVAAYIVSF